MNLMENTLNTGRKSMRRLTDNEVQDLVSDDAYQGYLETDNIKVYEFNDKWRDRSFDVRTDKEKPRIDNSVNIEELSRVLEGYHDNHMRGERA